MLHVTMKAAVSFRSKTTIGLFALLSLVTMSSANLVITEVASKGSDGVCEGRDWVEIYNSDASPVDLFARGYVIHDDKGIADPDAFFFPEGTVLETNEYLLLCTKNGPETPQFGIGNSDTITLAAPTNSSVSVGRVMADFEALSSVGPLPSIVVVEGFKVSYALDMDKGSYGYTSTPTPGAANILTPVRTTEEQVTALKAHLSAQNELGTKFFNMDGRGHPVPDAMDTVVDLHLTMLEEAYNALLQNATYELYSPFQSAALTTRDKPDEVLLSMSSPGRIRSKGQFSLYMPLCIGSTNFPFQVEFASSNSSQTLFGAERVYLRTHFGDNSYTRDWAYYRMAARFGLPHLRARKVRFFINGQQHGFYTLLEAPDQDYVFHRNFPLYDPANYALYKVKTMAMGCGQYGDAELEQAEERLISASEATPPYHFERGSHKDTIAVQGPMALQTCFFPFVASVYQSEADAVLAYLRNDKNCADMLLKEGLIDRDLGTSTWDSKMGDFIDSGVLNYAKVTAVTSTEVTAEPYDPTIWLDLDSTLKMIAFYAVTVNMDSPLGSGNNFYWARSGEEVNGGSGGWSMFPYDFNVPSTLSCGSSCDAKLVHWSILQPTCSHLSKNPLIGPILSDPELQAGYLKYVAYFVEGVYGNASFVKEIQDQIEAQAGDVAGDSWSAGGLFYAAELSPEASQWNESIPNFPLLPTMKARAASVREQLEAISTGIFPRGANDVGVGGDYEVWESCPDWRLADAPGSQCPQSCRYEGCHMTGWVVESYCDESTNTCVHGDSDLQCEGVPDLGRYEGMEEGPGIMCMSVNGLSTKMSPCPPYEEPEEMVEVDEEEDIESGANAVPTFFSAAFVLMVVNLWF